MNRFRIVERSRPSITSMDYVGIVLDHPLWKGKLYPRRETLQLYANMKDTVIQERAKARFLGHVATLPIWKDDMPVAEALMFLDEPEF
jgi:hypothetical protein